ncbi:hypothetical protein [Culicoidibacter larvae]|uniref:Uncharacterized protein n=1 Tax=Culicoidibacter larvae TaxID=2579976 RepID=A0A5R8Q905_9FIRM|nr:hypothetical protein [Culicoidibacter larvae]TLG72125.1 hypothetical protein FEZ08_09860 [Culicoidibacter larvae]
MKKVLSWKKVLIGSLMVLGIILVAFVGLRICFTVHLNNISNQTYDEVYNRIALNGVLFGDELLGAKVRESVAELLADKDQEYELYMNLAGPEGYDDNAGHLFWKFAFPEQIGESYFAEHYFWQEQDKTVTYLEVLNIQLHATFTYVTINEKYEALVDEYRQQILDGTVILMPVNFDKEQYSDLSVEKSGMRLAVVTRDLSENNKHYTIVGVGYPDSSTSMNYMFRSFKEGDWSEARLIGNPEFLYQQGYIFDNLANEDKKLISTLERSDLISLIKTQVDLTEVSNNEFELEGDDGKVTKYEVPTYYEFSKYVNGTNDINIVGVREYYYFHYNGYDDHKAIIEECQISKCTGRTDLIAIKRDLWNELHNNSDNSRLDITRKLEIFIETDDGVISNLHDYRETGLLKQRMIRDFDLVIN